MSEATANAQVELAQAFGDLVAVVREWRRQGRSTTTAGVKSWLQSRPQGFDEKQFGFEAFRDFVQAAEGAGHVALHRQENGHWVIALPGEAPKSSLGRDTSNEAQKGQPFDVRSDLWAAFVDWSPVQRRLWDKQTARAFMFPVSENNSPAWETDPDRFTEITPATLDIQLDWMKLFAEGRPSNERDILLRALAPDAPRGQFRRELSALGLQPVWRTQLQRHISEFVLAWARENSVPDPLLSDKLERRRSAAQQPASKKHPVSTADEPPRKPADASSKRPGGYDEDRLRELLHRAVDRMSLAELMSIPVRAEHLLIEG